MPELGAVVWWMSGGLCEWGFYVGPDDSGRLWVRTTGGRHLVSLTELI